MSILDALKVQKAEQKSVQQLAMLPQDQIVKMAQMGQIPAEVLPVVISEKARMNQEMANIKALMAQGGNPQSTVLEKSMAVNAQAENPMPQGIQGIPQGIPQGAPQGPAIAGVTPTPETEAIGVSALPTNQMFNQQNFAGGGIVAFAGEGRSDISLEDLIAQQQRQDPSFAGMYRETPAGEGEPKGFRRRFGSLAEAIAEAGQARAPLRELSAEEKALQDYLKKVGPRSEADATQSAWMRALEAGLGIMGGTSPYALTNIGEGSKAALRGFGEDVKERRKGELATMAAAAEQARKARQEKLEDVAAGERLFKEDVEAEYRNAVLNKTTDYQRRYENYLPKVMKDLGISDPTDPNVKAETARRVDLSIGAAGGKLEQRREEEFGDRASTALTNTRNELKSDNQYRILSAKALGGKTAEEKAERQREAEAYALKLLNKNRAAVQLPPLTSLPEGTTPPIAPAATSSQVPPAARSSSPPNIANITGVPAGSKVGKLTPQGWEVLDKTGKLIGHVQE